jgi:hypothetical protein
MSATKQLHFRLNSAELALITYGAKRDGVSVSAFVRGAALSAATRQPYLTPVDFEAIGQITDELRAVGINLNQTAYQLNRLALGDDRVRIDESAVHADLAALNGLLDRLASMQSRWAGDEL